MITIVGGTYHELCMVPHWNEYYGSGARAASALAALGGDAELYSYSDEAVHEVISQRGALENFKFYPQTIAAVPKFAYHHSLETPHITVTAKATSPLRIVAERVIRYGMIEGDAIVSAKYAVYDPQNPHDPRPFAENGSTAEHLALVLNEHEAKIFSGIATGDAYECGSALLAYHDAEVVIVKMGPKGALVIEPGQTHQIPAFKTDRVWKIGSGDTFVAAFGKYWMDGLLPQEAAYLASKATAYYCENRGFPTAEELQNFGAPELKVSSRFAEGYKPNIYLAGPFFSLAQLWLIDEARKNLSAMGLEVFSPYHDVGKGSADDVVEKDLQAIRACDVMLAVGDGLDSGTMYEIGYARAFDKHVVMYSENETSENKKMMEGSGCHLCDDYVSSIYKAVWLAVET